MCPLYMEHLIHTPTHLHQHTHTPRHTHTHTYTHRQTHTHIHTYPHPHTQTQPHPNTPIHKPTPTPPHPHTHHTPPSQYSSSRKVFSMLWKLILKITTYKAVRRSGVQFYVTSPVVTTNYVTRVCKQKSQFSLPKWPVGPELHDFCLRKWYDCAISTNVGLNSSHLW